MSNAYYEEEPQKVTTAEEWMENAGVANIMITNKKTGEGYLRFQNTYCRKLYDENKSDFDPSNMECLRYFIMHNEPTRGNKVNDVESIWQDIVKKCYIKKLEFYDLKWNEYLMPIISGSRNTKYAILNAATFTFTPANDLLQNKILLSTENNRLIYAKPDCDIRVVDGILSALVPDKATRANYRQFLHSLIVESSEEQIFYDNGCGFLTTWIHAILDSITGQTYVDAAEYYEDKTEFNKSIKKTKPRCVIIGRTIIKYRTYPVEKQIADLRKKGFKHFIVCLYDQNRKTYDFPKYHQYLEDNKDEITRLIQEENNYTITHWKYDVMFDDSDIFYRCRLLLTNFIKWACVSE
jgi:hypothetical protein